MSFTGKLGIADSRLGNIVPASGAIVPANKARNTSDSGTMSDAASSARILPVGIHVSASDSAVFTATASLSPVSQTVIGWVSPEQSTVFRPIGGFYVTPNNVLGVAVYASTVSFDMALSHEYGGADLVVTAFWTSNLSASWSGTLNVQIFSGGWQISNNCWSGSASFTFPSVTWALQSTRVVLLASSAPFALLPGRVYTVAFTIVPTGSPGGFGSLAVPFLLLEAEIQNK